VTKYLIALAAFVVLGLLGYGQYQRAQAATAKVAQVTQQRDALAASLAQAEKDKKLQAAISGELQRKLNALAEQSAAKQKALNDALKANRPWADAPVPDSVWDALGVPGAAGDPGQAEPRVDRAGPEAAADGPRQRSARRVGQAPE
jgi:hypothetical protein